MATSPANVFAMKIRAVGRDIDDFRLLAEIIGLKFSRGSFAYMRGVHLGESVSARSTASAPAYSRRAILRAHILRRAGEPAVEFTWRVMRRAVRLLEWGLSEGSARRQSA